MPGMIDVFRVITELRSALEDVEDAIASLERLDSTWKRARPRPPFGLTDPNGNGGHRPKKQSLKQTTPTLKKATQPAAAPGQKAHADNM